MPLAATMKLKRALIDRLSKLGTALAFLAWLQPGLAQGMTESQIKTAYVLNFAKFVEWPAGAIGADKLTLCVVGYDVLGGALSALDGRKAGERELRVLKRVNAEDNLRDCNVVYIGASEQRRFVAIINALRDSPALTISDIENFAEKGGGIGLEYRENKIVFEVNLASVQKSRLRFPGQLLNLASYVYGR